MSHESRPIQGAIINRIKQNLAAGAALLTFRLCPSFTLLLWNRPDHSHDPHSQSVENIKQTATSFNIKIMSCNLTEFQARPGNPFSHEPAFSGSISKPFIVERGSVDP